MPSTQTCPDSHVTSLQLGSTQKPPLQTREGGQTNSPVPHFSTQLPLSQTKPAGQMSPSSMVPLQSSSRPLQVSCGSAGVDCTHVTPVAVHWVSPGAQMPGKPVSQGWPPPAHVRP